MCIVSHTATVMCSSLPSFILSNLSPESERIPAYVFDTMAVHLASSPRSLTKVKLMAIVAKVTVLCSLSQLQPSVKNWLYCK